MRTSNLLTFGFLRLLLVYTFLYYIHTSLYSQAFTSLNTNLCFSFCFGLIFFSFFFIYLLIFNFYLFFEAESLHSPRDLVHRPN